MNKERETTKQVAFFCKKEATAAKIKETYEFIAIKKRTNQNQKKTNQFFQLFVLLLLSFHILLKVLRKKNKNQQSEESRAVVRPEVWVSSYFSRCVPQTDLPRHNLTKVVSREFSFRVIVMTTPLWFSESKKKEKKQKQGTTKKQENQKDGKTNRKGEKQTLFILI